MPKKNKPAAKGPFFFFMLEFKQKQEATGYRFKGGMPEVMERASPHWDKLAPHEREPYNQKAKQYKANPKDKVGERYTAQGIPYSQVENAARMRRENEESIQKDIHEMIQTAVTDNALEDLQVFFISCNYFCVTSTNRYIPAELAIVKYSLSRGIIDKLHILINPQKLPLGMSLDAEQHMKNTHNLPLPPNALGETDYEIVLQQILSFIRDNDSGRTQLPPLFTFNSDMAMVKSVLSEILYAAETDDLQFCVYPLNDYFYHLKQATENYGLDITTFPSVFMAKAILEKDIYAYSINIGCEVHEELENPISCALSQCVRWAYTISDSCCLDLGIEMEGGRHIPANMTLLSDITETVSILSSRVSKLTTLTTNSTTVTTHGRLRRPLSSERGGKGDTDQTGTTIFSSRAGTTIKAQDRKPTKDSKSHRTINETFNTTNPFYALQMEDDVPEPKVGTKQNPWSRETKLSEVRLPQEVPPVAVAGRGRGTLIRQTLNQSANLKTIGRGCLN